MRFHDEGFGFDIFGLHPPTAKRVLRAALPVYRHYFAVESQGHENIPVDGGAILVANHGGMLPIDAAMLWTDVVHRTGRYARMIADRFVPRVPFVSTLFARAGVVSGTHANVRRLLDRGELLAVFPEGVTGPAKPFRQRYELQDWRVGHAELAIRHRVPIIPVAIIGAEESWPVLARLHVRMFGAPYLPIPMAPMPLPIKFRIHYGTPVELHRDHAPTDADDPACLAAAAATTRRAVAELVLQGLTARDLP